MKQPPQERRYDCGNCKTKNARWRYRGMNGDYQAYRCNHCNATSLYFTIGGKK